MADYDLITKQVQASIDWLDEHEESLTWRGKLCPERLSMTSLTNCVLGQIYGSVGKAPQAALNGDTNATHGFNCGLNRERGFTHIYALQEEWLKRIAVWRKESEDVIWLHYVEQYPGDVGVKRVETV